MTINNIGTLKNIVTTGETQVITGAGVILRIIVNKTNTAALTVYDSLATSGTKIATIAASCPAGSVLSYGGSFGTGLRVFNGDAVRASGTLTNDTTEIADGDTVTIGTTVYRFKTTMTQAYDVKRNGATPDTTLANLVKAINGTGTAGSEYFAGTVAHTLVTAGAVASHATVVTAIAYGTGGNSIATTTTATHDSWGAATLASGAEGSAFDITVATSTAS